MLSASIDKLKVSLHIKYACVCPCVCVSVCSPVDHKRRSNRVAERNCIDNNNKCNFNAKRVCHLAKEELASKDFLQFRFDFMATVKWDIFEVRAELPGHFEYRILHSAFCIRHFIVIHCLTLLKNRLVSSVNSVHLAWHMCFCSAVCV